MRITLFSSHQVTIVKLILAPMEGLTDPIMRDVLTHVGSFDWCVTEFIRVTDSVLPDHVYHSYCPELNNQGKTAAGHTSTCSVFRK